MNKILLALVALSLLVAPAIADQITVTADVPPYVSAVFSYNTVNFGTVQPGSTYVPAPGQEKGIYNVTLTSNVDVSVIASRSPWLPDEGIDLWFQNNVALVLLTKEPQLIGTLSSGSYTDYHSYWLTIPALQRPGTYSTTVTITYQPA